MKKIAVVEDNPDNLLLLSAILEDYFEINEYQTGKEALEGITNDVPHLVLLDLSLPGMDGTEVLVKLRTNKITEDIPVIAITAHAMTGDREKYLALGFDEYLTKPILDEEIILESINKLLID